MLYCSMHMPIMFVNFKFCGAKQDSAPYMVYVILTHIPFECGVIDPYVDRFFDGFDYAMVLPLCNGEVVKVGTVC